jgi:hypothetical protein
MFCCPGRGHPRKRAGVRTRKVWPIRVDAGWFNSSHRTKSATLSPVSCISTPTTLPLIRFLFSPDLPHHSRIGSVRSTPTRGCSRGTSYCSRRDRHRRCRARDLVEPSGRTTTRGSPRAAASSAFRMARMAPTAQRPRFWLRIKSRSHDFSHSSRARSSLGLPNCPKRARVPLGCQFAGHPLNNQ